MKIYIDGDGCPVKKETREVALEFQIPVILVTAYEHFSNEDKENFSEVIYVDKGLDSADFKLLSIIKKGDICISQDYGLASLLLQKGVTVFHQNFQYTNENISGLMERRYYNQQLRKAKKKVKGPKALTAVDRQHFKKLLQHFLQQKTLDARLIKG